MTMTLYYGEPNGPSLTVLAALNEKQVQADYVSLDLTLGERYQHKNLLSTEVLMSVEGEGPVLVVDDEPMADSVFIGCYLDEISTVGSLVPGDSYQRWEVNAWCRYIIERTAPAAAYIGTQAYLAEKLAGLPGDEFAHLIAAIGSDDSKERWIAVRANDFSEEKLLDSRNKIQQAVAKVEQALHSQRDGQWILGVFSLADLETYAWLAGMAALVPEAFIDTPLTQAWLARVKARPSVQKALQMAKAAEPEKVWAPGPEINRWG